VTELHLKVEGYEDSDDRERGELADRLRSVLRKTEAEDVRHPEAAEAAGGKGSALEWAQLVVTLAGSLPALLGAVNAWVNRHPGVSIQATIDGDTVTLSDTTPEERRELLDAWLERHG
jgi:hypothetical protein